MAGVLSRPTVFENIQTYFQRGKSQSQRNHTFSNASQQTETRRIRMLTITEKTNQCDVLGIITDTPKYKQYCTVQSRIESFKNWPSNKTQTKKELAEAGFAYTGTDDCVRCFHCTIGLKDWPEGACPWEQHVLANPKCGHVIQCKGKVYVKNVFGKELSDSDVEDTEDVIDTVKLAMKRNEGAVTVARDFCEDENLLRAAVKAVIKNDIHRRITAVELVKAIDVLQERAENQSDIDVETDGDVSESEEDLSETYRKLKDPVTCKICFDATACIVTLPCGHMASCSQCIAALTKCAVCRAQIKGRVRALMAV